MLSTSVNLLERLAQRDDHAAWERLVALYSPMLFHWSRQGGLSSQEATDLVQDIFVVLLNELPSFRYDPQRGSFRGWLKTITLRRCRDQRQRWRPEVAREFDLRLLQDDGRSDPFWDEEYRRQLVRRAFELMRGEFEPTTWQACWEHVVSGRTAAEVGRDLGLSEAAVYVAKSRVLRRLREELDGLLE